MSLTYTFTVIENVLIVRLAGEIDHHEATDLREHWQQVIRENEIDHVILNLEAVTFMDSSGIGVILGRYKETNTRGGQFIVCAIQPSVHRLFTMSGLNKIIQVTKNEESALSILGVAS